MKAVKAAIEHLDGVQTVVVKFGATSTITMKPGKTLTKEAVQKALTDCRDDSPFKVSAFAEAKAPDAKKDDDKKSDKKDDDKKSDKKSDKKDSDKKDSDKK